MKPNIHDYKENALEKDLLQVFHTFLACFTDTNGSHSNATYRNGAEGNGEDSCGMNMIGEIPEGEA
ncbi:hypothetical protein [Halobacillus alkaliphilus]|nr:hypothetical protein [Halobacillus alkaliphilus]